MPKNVPEPGSEDAPDDTRDDVRDDAPENGLPVVGARYRLIEQVGTGPSGAIFQGECLHTGKRVAVKQPHEHLCKNEAAHRFLESAAKAARMTHPNVAQIYDYGRDDDDRPYVVREWVEGSPVQEVIRNKAPIKPSRACELVGQVLSGLAATHAEGLLHLAIKPENVIVSRPSPSQLLVKLTDPGDAAALVVDPIQRFPRQLGYAAPEQFVGTQLAPWTDIYGMGALLYELLSGSTVVPAGAICGEPSTAAMSGRDRAIRAVSERFADPLSGVMNRALAHHPDERPQSADEFAAQLARYASHLPRFSSAARPARQPGESIDPVRGRMPIREVADQNLRNPRIPRAPAMPRISFGYDKKWSNRPQGRDSDGAGMSVLRRWLKSKKRTNVGG